MEQIPIAGCRFSKYPGFRNRLINRQKRFSHISCKDIVKIDARGEVYLIDVHHGLTVENLRRNPQVSISAVDEPKFMGYCLKGRAVVIADHKIDPEFIRAWEDNITSRLSKRLIYNLTRDKPRSHHPEAKLPRPKHLIIITVEKIVDLTPGYLRKD